MGNICLKLINNEKNTKKHNVQIATPEYEYSYKVDCSNQMFNEIPIASPIYEYTNNYQQNSYNYYPKNNGFEPVDRFLTGMLIGELIDNDCDF